MATRYTMAGAVAGVTAAVVAALVAMSGSERAQSLGLTQHGALVTAQDAGAADAVAAVAVAPGSVGQVLTMGDSGLPTWRAATGGGASLPDAAGVSDGAALVVAGGVQAWATLGAATLSVSATANGNGSAAGTASTITLGLPSGQAAASRSAEPATTLASDAPITRVEVVARISALTSSSGPGLAIGIGDSGAGDAGVGCVLSVRIASDAAWDASAGASVVASNYAAGGGGTFGAAPQDGLSWVRFVVSRDSRYAIYAGRGASRSAVSWTKLFSGDIATALSDGARANVFASIYAASAAGTTISAGLADITWTAL